MWRQFDWWLAGWTLAAAGWWRCSWKLVGERMQRAWPAGEPTSLRVSIFKPLPALRAAAPPAELVAALETFVAELDQDAELLLGIEEPDAARWATVVSGWRQRYPAAKLVTVCRPRPDRFLNPRVSWCHALAARARGPLWLWSDADIVAPPRLLATLRRELAQPDTALVSCPYVVRRVETAAMLLEALFVNVEFLPGVLACERFHMVQFAFGAASVFPAKTFRERLRWDELGARLADDNLLGRRLAPVRLSAATVETLPAAGRWREALLQYLRRQKTVRWCRPGGFAGLIVLMPVLGWLAAVTLQPRSPVAWAGLAATVRGESVAAWQICRRVNCPVRWAWTLPGWSVLRALTWLACWLPWPVVFRSQRRLWWSLYRSQPYGEAP